MIQTPLQNQLQTQVSRLEGDDFQEFVIKLMFFRYGADEFTTLRRCKDEGADGIIVGTKTVLACWGPQFTKNASQLKKAFEKKIQADFDSYKENWENTYPNWAVITNHDPAPEEIKFVDGLKPGSRVTGLSAIIHLINHEICLANRRNIFKWLQISNEFISQDVLDGLLDHILRTTEIETTVEYLSPLYVPDKIRLNFNQYDIDSVEDEYYELEEEYFVAIDNALSVFNDSELSKIKGKIRQDYNVEFGNSFADKFNNLTTRYLSKYATENDSEYRDVIRGLLFWIFEQCLIGKKIPNESSVEAQT